MERDDSNKHILEYLDSHRSHTWIKTKSLLIESSSANGEFLVELLVGGTKPFVSENYEFVYRNNSIILNVFPTFGLSGL